jgi:hypothetical protein
MTELGRTDPVIERLDDQIAWYDRKSLKDQSAFKRLKMIEILCVGLGLQRRDQGGRDVEGSTLAIFDHWLVAHGREYTRFAFCSLYTTLALDVAATQQSSNRLEGKQSRNLFGLQFGCRRVQVQRVLTVSGLPPRPGNKASE